MSSLPIFLRPYVKWTELDLTQSTNVIISTIGAVVGEFKRGPLKPTYMTSTAEEFTKRYGRVADPTISYAHDTVTTFMTQSNNCLVTRTVNTDAKHGGVSVLSDPARSRLIISPFGFGKVAGFEGGLSDVVLLSFSVNQFVTANSFTMNISDGTTTTAVGPVVYATSHNNTLALITAAIQSVLNSFGTGGTVAIHQETSISTQPRWVIIIRPPITTDLTFSAAAVTLGATQPTTAVYESNNLFDVYAENPGDWSSQYGIKLDSFDPGIRQRYTMSFSTALITSNNFNAIVDGTTVSVPYATSSDATLAAIAAALTALPTILSATVVSVPGTTSNDRDIQIIAQKPGKDLITWENVNVTGGASQASVVLSTYLSGEACDNSFYLKVYNKTNVSQTAEYFPVSLNRQLSALGVQQNIENVVNLASSKSYNIRVVQRTDTKAATFSLLDATSGDLPSVPTNIVYLAAGADGSACISGQINAGWEAIADRQNYPVSVLMSAGYTSKVVQKYMAALAERRGDCTAILDAPTDKQAAQTLFDYRMNDLDIDSSFAAMYSPDILIEDINTGEQRWIPPSGPVGAVYAYSDRVGQPQISAPAGLNRGKVNLALDLRYKYSEGEQELLHPRGINFILDRKITGPTVFAEETLQSKKSVLSSVHARRILNVIRTGITDGLDYTLFEPLSETTRFNAIALGNTILQPIKKAGGLYAYLIKCDEDNNTPDVIDADVLAYDIYLKITRVAKGIAARAILTRTGVEFTEVIATIDNF